jgi:hypothetical protein
MFTNKPIINDNEQTDSGSVTFNNWWIAEGNWDFIFNFDWNFSDIIDPLNDLTRFLAVNPVFEAYGTVDGSFSFHFDDNWWFKISAYVDPVSADVLSASLWYPVANYPTWWEPRDPKPRRKGICFGAKSSNFPVHSQIWLDFGYPTCAWSIGDFLSWDVSNSAAGALTWTSIQKRYNDVGFICKSKE